eukprot:TRINITY_DN7919_c0_g1_i1.p2 TRINITY_DN7919_c0_g1~~TRINITY_DN7919_c0_g1_i1.p2  ORF type:complete len:54 (+),score=9.29 TRINITY_DN7919_c0_g1_i1:61-222(+)
MGAPSGFSRWLWLKVESSTLNTPEKGSSSPPAACCELDEEETLAEAAGQHSVQ